MPILNYTTTIDAQKTCGEIFSMLGKKGARRITSDYDDDGLVKSIEFIVNINGFEVRFLLPANYEGVLATLKKQKVTGKYLEKRHVINVTWRIIKDWIEAQMALIESQQADFATVFLPYAIMKNNKTVSENLQSGNTNFLMIE
jgi:hypothetical protein